MSDVPVIGKFSPEEGPTGTKIGVYVSNSQSIVQATIGGKPVKWTRWSKGSGLTLTAGTISGPIGITNKDGLSAMSKQLFQIIAAGGGGSTPPVVRSISSFTPNSGVVGTVVTLAGTGFSGITDAKINGISATYSIDSNTSMRVNIPTGATSGAITILVGTTTVASTATSFTVTTPSTGLLSFTTNAYSAGESDGTMIVTLVRSSGTFGAATATVTTANGTATSGTDYTGGTYTATWADGVSGNKTISIPILSDATDEPNETFTMALTVSGANLGTITSATGTIVDDDAAASAGVLSFGSATASIQENGGSLLIPVTRSGGTAGAISCTVITTNGTAVSPGDFTGGTYTLNWANAETGVKNATIPIIDDNTNEASETFTAALGGYTGGATAGSITSITVTIMDNDPIGVIGFATTPIAVGEADGNAVLTVTRTNGSAGAVTVDYTTVAGTATAGSDYTTTSGTFSWAAGNTANKTVTVPIINDVTVESGEAFTVVLSNATGGATLGTSTATVNIVDNDSGGTGPFGITLSGNQLVSTVNNTTPVYLRGVNVSGYETSGIQGYSPGDASGGQAGQALGPKISALQGWKVNCVRIPLNSASVLGHKTWDMDSLLHVPAPNHLPQVKTLVDNLTAAGIYSILDLHWDVPGNLAPMMQEAMAYAQHAIPFWTLIANTFKDNPAVCFETFNEPFLDTNNGGQLSGTPWSVLSQGGTNSKVSATSNNFTFKKMDIVELSAQTGQWYPGDTVTQGSAHSTVRGWDIAGKKLYVDDNNYGGVGTFTTGTVSKTAGRSAMTQSSRSIPTPLVSSGTAANVVSSNYNNQFRTSGTVNGQRISFDLTAQYTAGMRNALLQIENELCYSIRPDLIGQSFYNLFGTYEIQIAQGSAGVEPTNWTTFENISTTNNFTVKQHLIPLYNNFNWVRILFHTSNGSSGNADIELKAQIWDATNGPVGGILFAGDSLTANGLTNGNAADGETANVTVDGVSNLAGQGGFILTLGSITGGTGYTNGSYNVPFTGGAGSGATARITVSGNTVTAVALVDPGIGYAAGNTLSATIAGGSGFSVPVATIQGAGLYASKYPPTVMGGLPGFKLEDYQSFLASNPTFLSNFQGRFVGITLGTNNTPNGGTTNLNTFETNLTSLVNLVKSYGLIPVVTTIPYSSEASRSPNTVSYNARVANVQSQSGVMSGPDFYTFFQQNPYLLRSDGIHFSSRGIAAYRRLWAMWLCQYTNTATGTVSDATGGADIAGHQQMINAIRATGATNVVLVGGLAYNQDLSQMLANIPTDPAGKMGISWHPYPPQQGPNGATKISGGTVYSAGDILSSPVPADQGVYRPMRIKASTVDGSGTILTFTREEDGDYYKPLAPSTSTNLSMTGGSGSGAVFRITGYNAYTNSFLDASARPQVETILNTYPMVWTESGEHNSTGTVGAPHIVDQTAYIDSLNTGGKSVGITAWTWDTFNVDGYPTWDNTLIKDVNGTPSDGLGVAFKNWTFAHT